MLTGVQTKTTTWDDPRVPSLNPESDQTKRDFRRKLASHETGLDLTRRPNRGRPSLMRTERRNRYTSVRNHRCALSLVAVAVA